MWESLKSWYESGSTAVSSAASSVYGSLWGTREAATPATDNPYLWTSPPPTPALPKALPTWDEMSIWSKGWQLISNAVPGAVSDTLGISQRPGAVTAGTVAASIGKTVKDTAQSPSFILVVIVAGILGLSVMMFMFRPVR